MKKLIKLITGAFLLTALFTSCGNPAETAPEQDDGVQVEQFINKLMAVEYGINAAENAVIIHKMQNQEKSEYLYIKQNGSWISAGNIDLNNLKKENNEFYISADGKKIYSYSFTGNSLNLISSESGFINFFGSNTVTFNKISKDNLPTEIKNVLN